MKIASGFEIVDIADEHIVVPVGDETAHLKGVVMISNAAAYLLRCMEKPKTKVQLKELLVQEYDIDETQAQNDLEQFLSKMLEIGVIET